MGWNKETIRSYKRLYRIWDVGDKAEGRSSILKATFFTLYFPAGVLVFLKSFHVCLLKETSHSVVFLKQVKYGCCPGSQHKWQALLPQFCLWGRGSDSGPHFSPASTCGLLESAPGVLCTWARCWVFAKDPSCSTSTLHPWAQSRFHGSYPFSI